jgi:hypothetical protein
MRDLTENEFERTEVKVDEEQVFNNLKKRENAMTEQIMAELSEEDIIPIKVGDTYCIGVPEYSTAGVGRTPKEAMEDLKKNITMIARFMTVATMTERKARELAEKEGSESAEIHHGDEIANDSEYAQSFADLVGMRVTNEDIIIDNLLDACDNDIEISEITVTDQKGTKTDVTCASVRPLHAVGFGNNTEEALQDLAHCLLFASRIHDFAQADDTFDPEGYEEFCDDDNEPTSGQVRNGMN